MAMSKRFRPWWLVIATVVPVLPPAARAAEPDLNSPRRPYVETNPAGDLEVILKQNLERLRNLKNLRSLMERLKGHADLLEKSNLFDKDLLDRIKSGNLDLDDSQTKKKFGDLFKKIEKNPGLMEQFKKELPQDLLKDLDKDLINQDKLNEFKKLLDPKENQDGNGPDPKDPQDLTRPPPFNPQKPLQPTPQPPADAGSERDFADTMRNWLERMENWQVLGDMFRESPTIQAAIGDLTLSLMNGQGGSGLNAGDWMDRFGNWADFAEKGMNVFGNGLATFNNLPMPSLPSLRLPSLGLGGMPSIKLPSVGAPGPGGGGMAIFQFLLWGGLIVAVGLVLWQIMSRYFPAAKAAGSGQGWQLGTWPVEPGQVATRQELIAAFEYLSLLLLGPAARSWNHLDIAAGLEGEPDGGAPAQRTAAHHLAALYEVARYAPGTDPLSPEALADARRELCFLAGLSPA
jgi:hypothetical protein